jgi:hypothetical protein
MYWATQGKYKGICNLIFHECIPLEFRMRWLESRDARSCEMGYGIMQENMPDYTT